MVGGLRRLLVVPFALALASSPLHAGVVLDRAGAVNAVLSQLAPTGSTVVWCPYVDYGFGHKGLLPAGTIVRPQWAGDFPHVGNTVTLTCPMYVFFVDPVPSGIFTHEVQFVYVDATVANPNLLDGTMHVEQQGWWPVLRRFQYEESFFGPNGRDSELPAGVNNPDGLVFDAVPPAPPARFEESSLFRLLPADATDNSKACVIVVTGVDSTASGTNADGTPKGPAEKGLTASAKQFKDELINRGVPAGRVFTRLNATRAQLRDVIKRSCAASVNPPCDKIYFYVGTHGGRDTLQFRNEFLSADTLCAIFKGLGAKNVPVCLMIEACKSGSLIDNLRPKLPLGVIITATDSIHLGAAGAFGPANNFPGAYWYAFRQCWNNLKADTLGNKNGTVEWNEAYKWVRRPGNGIVHPPHDPPHDVNDRGPRLAGLSRKKEKKNKPGVGWISTDKTDWDQDGAFDRCTWAIDKDCDGTVDLYTEEFVFTGDGKNRRVATFYRDQDDDGVKETRYEAVDINNDGQPDSLYCATWNGTGYTTNASIAPRSTDSFSIAPGSGTEYGGQSFTLNATSTSWSNPNVKVFIGSEATDVVWLGSTQLQGVTTGFFEGPHDVIVADFDPFSSSYGFDVLNDGYTYAPEMAVGSVEPDHAYCGQFGTVVTVSGYGFDPGAVVRFDGIVLPTTWVNAETLTASVPPCYGPVPVSVSVENLDLESASRDSAFTFLPDPDTMPPVIGCPPELYLSPGADGLARTPAEWTASAFDDSGPASVARSTVGALPGGDHTIRFDAVDDAGNRSSCTVLVHVSGSSTVPTPPPAAFALGSPYPNPFAAAASIRVALPEATPLRLRVFSIAGQLVATIADRPYEPGEHDLSWNGLRDAGGATPNGVYFLHLEAGTHRATRRVTLIR